MFRTFTQSTFKVDNERRLWSNAPAAVLIDLRRRTDGREITAAGGKNRSEELGLQLFDGRRAAAMAAQDAADVPTPFAAITAVMERVERSGDLLTGDKAG